MARSSMSWCRMLLLVLQKVSDVIRMRVVRCLVVEFLISSLQLFTIWFPSPLATYVELLLTPTGLSPYLKLQATQVCLFSSHSLLLLSSRVPTFLQLYGGKGKTNRISPDSREHNSFGSSPPPLISSCHKDLIPIQVSTKHLLSFLVSSPKLVLCIYLFCIFDLNEYNKNIAGDLMRCLMNGWKSRKYC